jgi:hypothetical protein
VILNVGTIDLNLQRIWPTPRTNCMLCACVKLFSFFMKDVATATEIIIKGDVGVSGLF